MAEGEADPALEDMPRFHWESFYKLGVQERHPARYGRTVMRTERHYVRCAAGEPRAAWTFELDVSYEGD